MKERSILWLIAIAGILLLGSSSLYKSSPLSTAEEKTEPRKEIKNPYFQDFANNFDQYFKTQLKNTYTPGAAVVILKDTSVYLMEGYGVKQNSSRNIDSIDVNTLFRIGSLSKGFASILTGTYVEDELIAWDDKIQDYIPEFELNNANRGSDVSMEHLLSQTSGVSYHAYTSAIESGWSLDKIIPRFKTVKLTGGPGEIYSYQNAIYSLVGKVFEQKSDIPLDSIYQERIFDPLGMKDASVTYKGMKDAENRASPHLFRRYWKPTSITKKYYNAVPAGGVNASIADMAQWLQLLLGNRENVIKEETLDKIFSSHINTRNRRKYFSKWRGVKESHYGLGWRIVKREHDSFVYHGGYVNGFKSEILMNRKDKVAICILTNAPSQLSSIAIPTFINKYDHYRELIMSWNPEEQPVL